MGIGGRFTSKLKACAHHAKIADSVVLRAHHAEVTASAIVPKITAAVRVRLTVGIDMSAAVMAAVKSSRGAEEFHQLPPVPAHHVTSAVLQLVRKMTRNGFDVFCVFDGVSWHPLKAAGAGATRNHSIVTAKERLNHIVQLPWPEGKEEQSNRLSEILKLRKGSVKISLAVMAEVLNVIRENDIPFVVAPFEADWQLAYMFYKKKHPCHHHH